MKKALSLLLALVMCLSLCACGEQKPTGSQPGGNNQTCNHQYNETARVDATKSEDGSATYTCAICGDSYVEVLYATGSMGLEYEANDDGSYTVVGLGACTDSHVVIPAYFEGAEVTAIAARAFYECDTIEEITIPATVSDIGTEIFYKCANLHTVYYNATFGDPEYYFLQDANIKKVVFGGKNVPSFICYGMANIEEVVILDGVTSIGSYAFRGCSGLTNITIPDSVTRICDNAFKGCSSLTSITIPDGVTSIDSNAFLLCSSLTSITIPNSVTFIPYGAFGSCSSLQEIHFTGSMEQWNAISKGFDWSGRTGKYTIFCTDGEIQK